MTKAPRAGKVKTRLTPPLTPDEAAALNVCFLRDTTAAISGTVSEGHARGIAVYTPVGEEAAYAEILPGHFELVPQRGEAFGERLTAAAEDLLRIGFASVCLINSDSPTVPGDAYSQATRLLLQPGDRIVLGPSDDGGYYLIGMKKLHRRLFEEIDWSTERVFRQTLDRAREIGVPVELLPIGYDIDDPPALQRLCIDLLDNGSVSPRLAVETQAFLANLIGVKDVTASAPNE